MGDAGFGEIWVNFWSDGNLCNIGRDCALAYMRVCSRLDVANACPFALSIVNELYGCWYMGVAAQKARDESLEPNYGAEAFANITAYC